MSLFMKCASCYHYEEIDYKEAAKPPKEGGLNSGDCVLFSSSGFFSVMVQLSSWSVYSHVAVIIRTDKYKGQIGADPNGLYILQSFNGVIKSVPDVLTGEAKSGVQMNSLLKCLNSCKSVIHIRRLVVFDAVIGKETHFLSDSDKKTKFTKSKYLKRFSFENPNSRISKFIERVKGHSYETHNSELFNSVFPFQHPKDLKDSYFCSELVADLYKAVGILPKHANGSEYIPRDFGRMTEDGIYENFYSNWSYQPSVSYSGCRLAPVEKLSYVNWELKHF